MVTFKWLIAFMYHHMLIQLAWTRKCFVALTAFVGHVIILQDSAKTILQQLLSNPRSFNLKCCFNTDYQYIGKTILGGGT